MPFHHGKISTSSKLQRLKDYLLSRGKSGATGIELARDCGLLNPGGACSELRANGYEIQTTFEGTTDNGRKVYRYVLIGREIVQGELTL